MAPTSRRPPLVVVSRWRAAGVGAAARPWVGGRRGGLTRPTPSVACRRRVAMDDHWQDQVRDRHDNGRRQQQCTPPVVGCCVSFLQAQYFRRVLHLRQVSQQGDCLDSTVDMLRQPLARRINHMVITSAELLQPQVSIPLLYTGRGDPEPIDLDPGVPLLRHHPARRRHQAMEERHGRQYRVPIGENQQAHALGEIPVHTHNAHVITRRVQGLRGQHALDRCCVAPDLGVARFQRLLQLRHALRGRYFSADHILGKRDIDLRQRVAALQRPDLRSFIQLSGHRRLIPDTGKQQLLDPTPLRIQSAHTVIASPQVGLHLRIGRLAAFAEQVPLEQCSLVMPLHKRVRQVADHLACV